MKTIALFLLLTVHAGLAASVTEDFPPTIRASEFKQEAYFRSVGIPFQREDGSYVSPTTAATVDRVLMKKNGESYLIAFYRNDGEMLVLLDHPITISDVVTGPYGTVLTVGGDSWSCIRAEGRDEQTDMYIDHGRLVVKKTKKKPNQTPEPTPATGRGSS